MQRLTALGFDFTPKPERISWEERMDFFRKFKEEHGHLRITRVDPEMGHVICRLRTGYSLWEQGKPSPLSEERINELLELGFVFKVSKPPNIQCETKTWEERFDELRQFKSVNGHVVVPQKDGILGEWVKRQRKYYKQYKAGQKSPMTAEKALKLTQLGFSWDVKPRRSVRGDVDFNPS